MGGLFAFLVSWTQYVLTLLIGGGPGQTLPLLLFNFASAGRNDITGAIGILYILPGLLILLFTARHLTGANAALPGASAGHDRVRSLRPDQDLSRARRARRSTA